MPNLNVDKQTRNVKIPMSRVKPLKEKWDDIVSILVKQLGLQCMADPTQRPLIVSMRSPTNNEEKLQKGVEFIEAFAKGFDFIDCASLVKMDGLYIKTLYIKEVNRTIKGDHFTRAVGRVCGTNGIMRKKIENATRCRIVINDSTAHIMGTYQGIDAAYRKIGALVRGAPINKVVGKLASVKRSLDDTF